MTYGYIGLGMMGSAMAENLIGSGADVIVNDIDSAAVERAVALGASSGATPEEVARASDVVSICVPAAQHIDAVLNGEGGIAAGVHEGLSILVHSTVSPQTMRSVHEQAAGWGVPLFDACVAGGAENARAGEQLVLAGGVDDMNDEVLGLLDIYAQRVINGGPIGSGATLKIAFNVMTYAQFVAASTGYDLMVSQGADPASLFDAWRDQGQLGSLTETYSVLLGLPAELIAGDLLSDLETQVGISEKDLQLAVDLGETRRGAAEVLSAISEAMPAAYRTV